MSMDDKTCLNDSGGIVHEECAHFSLIRDVVSYSAYWQIVEWDLKRSL